MKKRKLQWGTSGDALLLTFIKLVTMTLSFVVTRLLSQYLTKYDYGTYSTILLIFTTVYCITILGMSDGVNYFYCSEPDEKKRESYIASLFAMQLGISIIAGTIVMALTSPLCAYFDNPGLRRLMIFAAALPLFQNLISMTQVLIVSIGKAKMIAIRNLIVSLVRLAATIVVISVLNDVAVILTATLLLDALQLLVFVFTLRKNNCPIRFKCIDIRLFKTILSYCVPMGIYSLLYTLNRDCDKYLIGLLTDTETLAMYTNASKVLPFDVIASSFFTVLLPPITRCIAAGEKNTAAQLYKQFMEITYVSTTILCCAVLAAAPQVMQLLYSAKYLDGVVIFCIYILVDLLRFANVPLILSAAGKTKTLMLMSLCSLVGNAVANVVLYYIMGITGPAVATLLTSLATALFLLYSSSKALDCRLADFFDTKYLVRFMAFNAVLTVPFYFAQKWLASQGWNYLAVIIPIFGGYALLMGLLHLKRFMRALKQVNAISKAK
ncbi:MAG: polysaccharide biosynthesis protein [Ruminococcaceae bacterium]|nr:polysaccharide biosynthesis protein [Oscillospiraceae bacterium]